MFSPLRDREIVSRVHELPQPRDLAREQQALSKQNSILIVEDDPPLARVYEEYLKAEPCVTRVADAGQAALAALDEALPAAIVLDLKLPDMGGLEVLKAIRDRGLSIPVIVVTAHGSINTAVEAMRAGAVDFILKPFNAERLIYTLRNALEHRQLVEKVERYEKTFDRREFCGFIGASLPMQGVYRTIESAAASKATVFVTGESGTGKEVCAEAVHLCSPRREKAFVPLNCAAIPQNLMESEIFGHVKGAFTGATSDREGAAVLADGGTLFLDEICELELDLQAKLLRFIQSSTFQKVGSSKTVKVDVRFVCATNRDPWAEVEAGRFREDLYYRLNVIPVHLPPLRERGPDVIKIAEQFLTRYAEEEGKGFTGFSPEAAREIAAFAWPGNVRQLQNVIRSLVVLNQGETVDFAMLPSPLGQNREQPAMPSATETPRPQVAVNGQAAGPAPVVRPMWQIEREVIREALLLAENNVSRAAAMLEVSPSTIYRRIREMEDEGLEVT